MNEINISDRIFREIKQGNLKMRPRWEFLAYKFGVRTILLFLTAAAIFIFSLVMYYCKINDLRHLLGFGKDGLMFVFFNFPYELTFLTGLLLLFINSLIYKTDRGYKYSKGFMMIFVFFVIFLFSGSVYAFGMHDLIDEKIKAAQVPLVKEFYKKRVHNIENKTFIGEISFVDNDQFEIFDENEKPAEQKKENKMLEIDVKKPEKKIETIKNVEKANQAVDKKSNQDRKERFLYKKSQLKLVSKKNNLKTGDKVKIIGENKNGVFKPWAIYKTKKEKQADKAPVIR